MKRKRILIAVTVLLAIVLLLCACSGGAPYNPGAPQNENNSSSDYDVSYESGGGAAPPNSAPAADSPLPSQRKIIRTASLSVEADDSAELYGKLTEYCTELGGYEHSYSISNHDGYSVISAVLKLPPENLSAFMHFAGENGKIINSSMYSEDITENYYDVETRLQSKRKALEQYYALLQKVETIEEIIQLQRTIDGMTEEIEALEGKLKLWNSMVDMSTVELSIRQQNDPIKLKKEINWNTLSFDDMGYLIKTGVVTVLNAIVSLVQWLFVVLLVASPLIIIAAVVLFIVLRRRKKRRNSASKPDETSEAPEPAENDGKTE